MRVKNQIDTFRWFVGLPLLLAFSVVLAAESDRTLKLGVMRDAGPFSYVDENENAIGYSVDLCRRIADAARGAGFYERVEDIWVRVPERFEKLFRREIDLLCEATTVTLQRMRHFDFTLQTFLSGGSFMYRADARSLSMEDLGSNAVSVVDRTTTLDLLQQQFPKARIVRLDDDREGVEMLARREVLAHFGDREVLLSLRDEAASRDDPIRLRVSDKYLSFEPYALVLRPDREDMPCKERRRLLLIANQTLVELYRTGEIEEIFQKHFPGHSMSPALKQMFRLQTLPEGESLGYVCESDG